MACCSTDYTPTNKVFFKVAFYGPTLLRGHHITHIVIQPGSHQFPLTPDEKTNALAKQIPEINDDEYIAMEPLRKSSLTLIAKSASFQQQITNIQNAPLNFCAGETYLIEIHNLNNELSASMQREDELKLPRQQGHSQPVHPLDRPPERVNSLVRLVQQLSDNGIDVRQILENHPDLQKEIDAILPTSSDMDEVKKQFDERRQRRRDRNAMHAA